MHRGFCGTGGAVQDLVAFTEALSADKPLVVYRLKRSAGGMVESSSMRVAMKKAEVPPAGAGQHRIVRAFSRDSMQHPSCASTDRTLSFSHVAGMAANTSLWAARLQGCKDLECHGWGRPVVHERGFKISAEHYQQEALHRVLFPARFLNLHRCRCTVVQFHVNKLLLQSTEAHGLYSRFSRSHPDFNKQRRRCSSALLLRLNCQTVPW